MSAILLLGGFTMFRKKAYNFSDRTHSREGIFSFAFGIISFIIFCFVLIQSILMQGKAGLAYGLIAFIAFFFALMGLVWAIMSYKDEDARMTFKYLGTGSNAVMLILCVGVFILGMFQ